MAYVWFGVSVLAAALVLLVVRRCYGVRRTMKRVALSLAVCERALEDALGELALDDDSGGEVFVSPFEPVVQRLARIPEAELCALGKPAAELGRRLAGCVSTWNAAAGGARARAALLPLLLEAHQIARELLPLLEEENVEGARSAVRDRVLVALVAPVERGSAWVQ